MSKAGICAVCKCTDAKRCQLYTGEECCWLTKRRDLCSSGRCIEQASRQRFGAAYDAYCRWERARRATAKRLGAKKAPRRTKGAPR